MTIVAGHDGSDSGDDAATLGALLARATGEDLLVVSVYPEENPIGIGRVDAEWVAYMRGQAEEVSDGAICPVAIAPRGLRERPADTPVKRMGVAFVDTPEGHEAVRVAGALAAKTGASLTLYTVVAPRAEVFIPMIGRGVAEAFMATVREDARAALDNALASVPAGVQASEELLEGDVVDELAALDEREIDLLVCGSRGYGPVRRVLLGGVSRRLIRRAACPVVFVPRGAG